MIKGWHLFKFLNHFNRFKRCKYSQNLWRKYLFSFSLSLSFFLFPFKIMPYFAHVAFSSVSFSIFNPFSIYLFTRQYLSLALKRQPPQSLFTSCILFYFNISVYSSLYATISLAHLIFILYEQNILRVTSQQTFCVKSWNFACDVTLMILT